MRPNHSDGEILHHRAAQLTRPLPNANPDTNIAMTVASATRFIPKMAANNLIQTTSCIKLLSE